MYYYYYFNVYICRNISIQTTINTTQRPPRPLLTVVPTRGPKPAQRGAQRGAQGGGVGLVEAQGCGARALLGGGLREEGGALGGGADGGGAVEGAAAGAPLLLLLGAHGAEGPVGPAPQATVGAAGRGCGRRDWTGNKQTNK